MLLRKVREERRLPVPLSTMLLSVLLLALVATNATSADSPVVDLST